MPNSLGLFSKLNEDCYKALNEYISYLDPPGKILDYKYILERYNHSQIFGWKISLQENGITFFLDILFPRNIPFEAPIISLVEPNYFFKWPHIEKNGKMCLKNENDSIIHNDPVALTKYYINEARELIKKSLDGQNKIDFISEFESYWIYKVEKTIASIFYLNNSIINETQPLFYTFLGNKRILAVTSIEYGEKWINDYYQKQDEKKRDYLDTAIFWLKKPLYPEDYPENNANISDIIKNLGNKEYDLLKNIIPKRPGKLPIIIGFDTNNGPALGGVWFNEPFILKNKAKKVYLRFNGFRAGSKIKPHPDVYLNYHSPVYLTIVEKINKQWLLERGGTGYKKAIGKARVCLIGCGALGSGIARILTQSGIEDLTLVDSDSLNWGNIARNVLGGEYVGLSKVEALKKFLTKQMPGVLKIQSESVKWQDLLIKNKGFFDNYDLIISATGNWDSDDALNYLFNSRLSTPIIYCWFEPYGLIGHALVINEIGGCFSCGFSDKGKFQYSITNWENVDFTKNEPGCSTTYQSYGINEILPIQSMVVKIAVDTILGNNIHSTHYSWVGDLNDITLLGGQINTVKNHFNGNIKSNRIIKANWEINPNCQFKHR